MITTYLQNKLIEDLFIGDYVKPTTYYLGVSTTAPNEDGTGFTEPVGNGYARIPLTRTTDFTRTANGTVKNVNDENFPISTGDWGNCTHWGIFDASTGGNLLVADLLTHARNIGIDMQLFIDANGVSISCVSA